MKLTYLCTYLDPGIVSRTLHIDMMEAAIDLDRYVKPKAKILQHGIKHA